MVYLASNVFRSLFTTAGDVLALISYIAAVIGAVFGVQIAVRGAQAAQENQANQDSAREAYTALASLKSELASLFRLVQTIGHNPAGQADYIFEPNQTVQLRDRVAISPAEIAKMEARLETIGAALRRTAHLRLTE